ncbi:MAG: SAM-dependent methyltransferase [Flavobacteriales bacterium]|nr:SAM-dependent methyltransferase [Flavobacteriales bacterium]
MAERKECCRVCNHKIQPLLSYGKMPIANGFINSGEEKNEYFFDLSPAFCTNCYTFQLIEQPEPEKMFHGDYAFFSRQSKFMQIHFKKYAEWVQSNYIDSDDDFIVEIGSNDGIMIENFKNMGLKHLGVDPSENVVEVAKSHGINSIVRFFGLETSHEIVADYGKADALICANVMCHLPDLNDIAKGAINLLKDDGVMVFEDPYLGDMLEKVSYDQIYDEHVYIFSAVSAQAIFGQHGFELINLVPQETHGGSMRYVFAKEGERKVEKIVDDILTKERENKFDDISTYLKFKQDCENSKARLLKILNQAKKDGKTVAGYGATSKSTTILNYCGIGPDLIRFISDTTPIKQDKLSPGTHIPVKSHEYFQENVPDIIFLFAWNHAKEIIEKEKDQIDKSVEWITHLPNFTVTR